MSCFAQAISKNEVKAEKVCIEAGWGGGMVNIPYRGKRLLIQLCKTAFQLQLPKKKAISQLSHVVREPCAKFQQLVMNSPIQKLSAGTQTDLPSLSVSPSLSLFLSCCPHLLIEKLRGKAGASSTSSMSVCVVLSLTVVGAYN